MKTIIIGGGVAGITAAAILAQNNINITLIEPRLELGGRLYSFKDKTTGEFIDNGQHLLIDAYSSFLNLLKILDKDNLLKYQDSFKAIFYRNNSKINFDTSLLPGKLGLAFGFLKLNTVSIQSKINLINFFLKLISNKIKIEDKTALEILLENHNNQDIIENFWTPLILAMMNCSPGKVSGKLFIEVIKRAFLQKKISRLIFPSSSLADLFSGFNKYLSKFNGNIVHEYVKKINIENNKVTGCELNNGQIIKADNYISAVPPHALEKFLSVEQKNNSYFDFLKHIEYSPIISIYLWFDKEFFFDDFASLLDSPIHWIFNRRQINISSNDLNNKYSAHVTLTISAADNLLTLNNKELIKLCLDELKRFFPEIINSKLEHSKIIKEKRATILATSQINKHRPNFITPINNLYIAGDWIDTGLPATIESASLSGEIVAKHLINIKN